MNKVRAGSYVQIHKIILNPIERSSQLPPETKKVPLEMFVKGFLIEDAVLGDVVKIKTVTNRIEEGKLFCIAPEHKHNFGVFVPEVIEMSRQIKEYFEVGDKDGSNLFGDHVTKK